MALAAEVRQVGCGVGVGDADVDDAAYTGGPGRIEHDPGVLDALLVGATAVVDANPIGVEQGIGASEGLGEQVGTVEVEGMQRHKVAEGVMAVRVSGDRLDVVSMVEQQTGDVTASVARGPGYGVFE